MYLLYIDLCINLVSEKKKIQKKIFSLIKNNFEIIIFVLFLYLNEITRLF